MEPTGLKIQIEYFDARSRLTQRRIREDVQMNLRKVESKDTYSEIRIKGLKTADIFVTNTASVVPDRGSINSLYLWISNYKCAITVFGTPSILKSIGDFFTQAPPVAKNKENVSPTKNTTKTPPKVKRGYGLIKDIFGSGYTPDSKARPGLKLGINTSRSPTYSLEKEIRRPIQVDPSNKPRQTTFMGLLAAAAAAATAPSSKPSNNETAVIPSAERFALTDTQNNVIQACRAGKNVFYTGGAGTGKSTLLTRLIELLIEQHGRQRVFVAATTGLAACAVGGTTVHQFAGISSVLDENSDASAVKVQFTRIVNQSCAKASVLKRFRDAKVLLVDEISMLSPVLLEILNGIAIKARGERRLMGGIQVVFCGDFFQLPPVTKTPHIAGAMGSIPTPSTPRFCFQSPLWSALIQESFDLQQVYRQSGDTAFIDVLNAIRGGEFTPQCRAVLGDCVARRLDCSDGILPTQIFTHKRDVDSLNNQKLAELQGAARIFMASDSGDEAFLRMLQSHCPARQRLELKVGAQVILVKTTAALEGLVNGARGIIVSFVKETDHPVVKFADGTERAIGNEIFTISLGGSVVAQRSQVPLDLSWGISVHKSQGMTVDKAQLHLKNVFECGQAYVALSRVRSVEGLSLSHALQQAQVRAHPEVVKFYAQMAKNV